MTKEANKVIIQQTGQNIWFTCMLIKQIYDNK